MITIMSATGNIGAKTVKELLARGEQVRAIGRNPAKLAELEAAGAELAIGDVADAKFLAKAFAGSTAVLTLIPPNYVAKSFGAHYDQVSEAVVEALKAAKVERVVSISSAGAEVETGTGPIKYLHSHEGRLNAVAGLRLTHLRPTFFMENLLMQIPTIQSEGILAGATKGDIATPMIATADIAKAAADELTRSAPVGVETRELLGPENVSLNQVAEIVSGVLKRPIKYVQVSYDDFKGALVGAGLSPDTALQFAEMSEATNKGIIGRNIRDARSTTPTKVTDFAKVFAQLVGPA